MYYRGRFPEYLVLFPKYKFSVCGILHSINNKKHMNNNQKNVGNVSLTESQIKKCVTQSLIEAGLLINNSIDLVDIEDAMKITHLARQTIYCKVSAGTIPYIKRPNSKKLFFSRQALIAWLNEKDGGSK